MRPDSTPPDASLFPIAPTFTADLDAKALDEIVSVIRMLKAMPQTPNGLALAQILEIVQRTGREV